MKKLNLYLILLLSVIFTISSCQKEETPEEPDYISANINGENWEGDPSIDNIRDNDSIWLGGFSEEEDWAQILGIKIKLDGEGDYSLNKNTNYYTVFEEDQMSEIYRLDESSPSHLTITEYDTKRNIIRGNFEMLLLLEKRSDFPEPADELIFKNGSFKITLDE